MNALGRAQPAAAGDHHLSAADDLAAVFGGEGQQDVAWDGILATG